MAVLGKVVSINGSAEAVGQVFVLTANGVKKVLKLNDEDSRWRYNYYT